MSGREIELQLLGAPRLFQSTGVVGDAVDRNAVVVGEDAADPHRGGHLVLGIADALADQIDRFANPAGGVHVDARMAEKSGRENRNGDKRGLGRGQRHDVRGQGHLGDIELPVPQHAEEGFFHRQRQVVQIDAIGLHALLEEGTRAVVVPTGQRQSQLRHIAPSSSRGDSEICFAAAARVAERQRTRSAAPGDQSA